MRELSFLRQDRVEELKAIEAANALSSEDTDALQHILMMPSRLSRRRVHENTTLGSFYCTPRSDIRLQRRVRASHLQQRRHWPVWDQPCGFRAGPLGEVSSVSPSLAHSCRPVLASPSSCGSPSHVGGIMLPCLHVRSLRGQVNLPGLCIASDQAR